MLYQPSIIIRITTTGVQGRSPGWLYQPSIIIRIIIPVIFHHGIIVF